MKDMLPLLFVCLIAIGCAPTLPPVLPTSAPLPPTIPPATSTPRAGEERVIGSAPMMYVPAGEFLMGGTDAQFNDAMEQLKRICNPCPEFKNDEKPEHTVYLDGFWMDKYQVTNARYNT